MLLFGGIRHESGRSSAMTPDVVCLLAFLVACLVLSVLPLAEANPGQQSMSRRLLSLPPYTRGKDQYQYILTEAERQNGMSYLPAAERLRGVLDKLRRGVPIRVATVGASIMAGQGTFSGPTLAGYIFNWLEDQYPGLVNSTNGAMPGTTSQYLSVCHNMHVPPDVDLVLVEFTISDGYNPKGPAFVNEPRRALERLIRKLLTYPQAPAVVLIHAYAWNQVYPYTGSYFSNAERDFGEFERYYHLPAVSTKAACYRRLWANLEGFISLPRRDAGGTGENNNGNHFYFDQVHPDERTGCRAMAELFFHLITKVSGSLDDRPLSGAERSRAAASLPEPMIPGNYEAASTRCFIGGAFTASVQGQAVGWEWINESKTQRPKWGYISTTPGSTIRLKTDTRLAKRDSVSSKSPSNDLVLVQLSHLRSYENMGQARVICEGGCQCNATVLQSHHTQRNSLTYLHDLYATTAEDCIVAVTVMGETQSGGHKVKLVGLVVSDEAGIKDMIAVPERALEYVGDVSMHAGGGGFDIRNHV